MAELAVVEVASNILSLIDIGYRVINSAARIYESASGASVESDDFELIETNFKDIRQKIEGSAHFTEDAKLLEICQLCKDIANDLIQEYDKLKVPYDGQAKGNRRLRCLWKATKGAWGRDYTESQKKRLESLKNELHLHLTVNLRSHLLQFFEESPRQLEKVDSLGRIILDAIKNNRSVIEAVELKIRASDRIEHEETRKRILQNHCLDKLQYAKGAAFNSYAQSHNPACLENTRGGILKEIDNWMNCDAENYIYWLNGFAGSGKSTIAQTVAHRYYDRDCLAASFFFSKTVGGDVQRSHKFVTTVAYQLANHLLELRGVIANALELDDSIIHKDLVEQWQQLIYAPLTSITTGPSKLLMLIVVDALDECDDYKDAEIIIKLLAGLQRLQNLRIKTFITSRPDVSIRNGFNSIPDFKYVAMSLHNVSLGTINDDIRTLFNNKFASIRMKRKLPANWPGTDSIETLVHRSAGLFIWAATACRFVQEGGIFLKRRLSKLLESDLHRTAPEESLDILYLTVLRESISAKYANYDQEEQEDFCIFLRVILGVIITSLSALSISAISRLTNIDEDEVSGILGPLHSILDISDKDEDTVKLHHPSFRDFLLNSQRCRDSRFMIDELQSHANLASGCIDIMLTELKRDICNLRELGTLREDVMKFKIEQSISKPLRYACQYWADHLQRSKQSVCDNSKALIVLEKHFSHWLEVLSLIGLIAESLRIIDILITLIDKSSFASDFIKDARVFVQNNSQIIDLAPLQLYCASLIFTPKHNKLYQYYEKETTSHIKCLVGVDDHDQSFLIQSFDVCGHSIKNLEFSPDNRLLACNSAMGSIHLWDVASGVVFQSKNTFKSCSSLPVFSHDSLSLLSAEMGSFELAKIDTTSGQCALWRHSHGTVNAAFTADGQLIAVLDTEGVITVLDTASYKKISTVGSGKIKPRKVLKFGLYRSYISWMDKGNEVEIDVSNLNPEEELPRFLKNIASCWNLALGLDGRKLLIISGDAVQLYEMSSGKLVMSVDLDGILWCKIFKSSKFGLFTKSTSSTGEVWDIFQGRVILKFAVNIYGFDEAAFSMDNRFFAITLNYYTIGIWDLTSGKVTTFDVPSYLTALAFSSDATCLATGCDNGVVYLWDIDAILDKHRAMNRFDINMDLHSRVSFKGFVELPDNILVSGHDSIAYTNVDRSITIRNTATGEHLQSVKDSSSMILSMAYSPVKDALVVSFDDRTLRLYEIKDGVEIKRVDTAILVGELIISNNGKHLVATSVIVPSPDRSLVELYNASSLELIRSYRVSCTSAVAFSGDGRFIALLCIDRGNIDVWDLVESERVHMCIEFGIRLCNIAMSFDGGAMIACSSGRTRTENFLYNVSSNRAIKLKPLTIDTCSFSPDNLFFVTLSDITNIGLWNVASGELMGRYKSATLLQEIAFSQDAKDLITDKGYLRVSSIFSKAKTSGSRVTNTDSEDKFFVCDKWVMKGSKRILWLPPKHRARQAIVKDHSIAIQGESGQFTLLTIEGNNPELLR